MFAGFLAFVALVLAWVAISRTGDLKRRITALELELQRLRRELASARETTARATAPTPTSPTRVEPMAAEPSPPVTAAAAAPVA
jgi:hypothetical protein